MSSSSAAARTDSIPSILTGCYFLAYAAIVVALPPFLKSLRRLLLFACGKGVSALRFALPPASSVAFASSSVLNFPSWYSCDYCSSSSLLYPTFCCLLPYLRHHLPLSSIYTQDFSHFTPTSFAFSSPPTLFHPNLAGTSCCCSSTNLHPSCSHLHPPFRDSVTRQTEDVELDCDTDDDVVVLYDVMI